MNSELEVENGPEQDRGAFSERGNFQRSNQQLPPGQAGVPSRSR